MFFNGLTNRKSEGKRAMIFNTFHSVSSISIMWLFFKPSTQSSDCLIFASFSCHASAADTHGLEGQSIKLRTTRLSLRLFIFSRKINPILRSAAVCLAACPPHFALRGSKFRIRGVTDQRAEAPLSSGRIRLRSVRPEWQCQVSPNRWVWQSG